MVDTSNKAFRHSEAGRLYPGTGFSIDGISFPANWLELASEDDLAAKNIVVSDDPTLTEADILQNEQRRKRDEKRQQQTDEIHASIGRYVESFEQVVNWVRTGCLFLTCLTSPPPANVKQQELMNVVFNHGSMTAGNLLAIYQALVGHITKDNEFGIDDSEGTVIRSVFQQFHADFKKAIETRNDFLHGTWFVGWGNEATEDWSSAGYLRGKATKEGLQFLNGPKTSKELDEHSAQHQRLTDYFLRFNGCLVANLHGSDTRVSRNFVSISTGRKTTRWEPWKPSP